MAKGKDAGVYERKVWDYNNPGQYKSINPSHSNQFYLNTKIAAIAEKNGIPVVEDAAEGMGSRFNGQVLGTFGKYCVLSFNGNKMITTSGGGALITNNEDEWREIMMYATQYRESYPYYQHEKIGFN